MKMDFMYNLFLIMYPFFAGLITLKLFIFFCPQNNFASSLSIIFPDILMPFGTLILINKDFFNGQSVINRYLGYQIVDVKTNQANPVRCATRNCTLVIWPIEVIFAMVNSKRRLGDYIAGTAMIETEKSDPQSILDDIRKLKFDSALFKTLLVCVCIAAFFEIIMRYI